MGKVYLLVGCCRKQKQTGNVNDYVQEYFSEDLFPILIKMTERTVNNEVK